MSVKSFVGKALILAAIGGAAALLIIITSLRKPEVREEPVLPVETVEAEKGDLAKKITISGFIESDTMVTVLPRIGGILNEIYPEMGDAVEKDQVLALIDSEPYVLTYNQAKAAFLAAESTYNRVSSLYSTKSVSQQNYDEARANYDALKASYELAELNLSYTELRSPVSGVVLEKHVSRGAMVASQVPVVTIGDISDLKVNCGIPEIHYSHFQRNKDSMDVVVTVPAMEDRMYSAKISQIAPYISPESRNFTALCRINDEEKSLRPGMFAYIDFTLEKRENVSYLPYAAISGNRLWYIDGDMIARSIIYEPEFGNEDFFVISADLADRRFVVKGQHFLEEGREVRLLGE